MGVVDGETIGCQLLTSEKICMVSDTIGFAENPFASLFRDMDAAKIAFCENNNKTERKQEKYVAEGQ